MTRKVIRTFLDNMNKYRNKIASGYEFGEAAGAKFPAAARMRELIWDNELAYLAIQQSSLMKLAKPRCANSVKYTNIGIIKVNCNKIKPFNLLNVTYLNYFKLYIEI